MSRLIVCLAAVGLLLTVFRTRLAQVRWTREGWALAPIQAARPPVPLLESDLDSDGDPEGIVLRDGHLAVQRSGEILWATAEEWEVLEVQITDLNRDGLPEVTMLVWRPFQPWPIDTWLPHGGRIAGFHDSENRSCHIILWGWAGDRYRELWAGSALAEPLVSFFAADWDGDGFQELLAVETGYDRRPMGTAVSLWSWNGFGFTLIDRYTAEFGGFGFLIDGDSRPSVLLEISGGTFHPRR